MRRTLTLIALVLTICHTVHLPAQVYEAKAKLVVILVIGQFRGDYLDRYQIHSLQLTASTYF